MDNLQRTAYAKMAGIDPPRINPATGLEEGRVRVGLVCRPGHQLLPGGHLAERYTGVREDGSRVLNVEKDDPDEQHGRWNIFLVYESDWEAIQQLVEDATEDDLAAVEREYQTRIRRWQKKAGEDADIETCPHSREAAFAHIMGRDMRPIIKAKTLDGDQPKKRGRSAA